MAAERSPDDFYETRPEVVRLVAPELGALAGRRILESSAGRGAIVRTLIDLGATPQLVTAIELDSGRAAVLRQIPGIRVLCRNFLACNPADFEPFDLAVGNPPFADAKEHLLHTFRFLAPWGQFAAMLPMRWIVGKGRRPFRRAHPCDLFPLAGRPGFSTGEQIGEGSGAQQLLAGFDQPIELPKRTETDNTEYAWFVYGAGRGGRYRVLEGENTPTPTIPAGNGTFSTFAALAAPREQE